MQGNKTTQAIYSYKMDVPLPPLLPGLFPTTNSMIRGSGILSWLSPKAGLITCSKPMHATVSFQIKDFCDSGVTDLTQFLRVGFRLAFHAIPNNSNEWIANYVSPISEQDLANGVTNDGQELNLESFEQYATNMPLGKAGKDTYSLEKEMRALSFLLTIFQKNSVHYIPLSNLHSRISNSGDQELSRYIGSSSLKRRQFIEDRSYIFLMADNDVVYLQAPEIYQTVTLLAGFLLTHGGVTSSDLLFSFFNKCGSIPVAIKESIQNRKFLSRQQFMQFLSRHPFAFAPFPSQYYVGVRRNLPFFDYATFFRRINTSNEKIRTWSSSTFQSYPNFQSRPVSRPLLQSTDNFEQLSSADVGSGLTPLAGTVNNHLGNTHSFGTLANANGQGQNNHGNTQLATVGGNINNAIGGIGSNNNGNPQTYLLTTQSQQQPTITQSQNTMVHNTTPQQPKQPLFSLFDDALLLPNNSTASIAPSSLATVSHQQNGLGKSIMSTGVTSSILSNNTNGSGGISSGVGIGGTGSSNIWTYDMDFFDRTKIQDVFSSAFNNGLSLGNDAGLSPPRKQFMEMGVQTDESSFNNMITNGNNNTSNVCANCAQKISNGKQQ